MTKAFYWGKFDIPYKGFFSTLKKGVLSSHFFISLFEQ